MKTSFDTKVVDYSVATADALLIMEMEADSLPGSFFPRHVRPSTIGGLHPMTVDTKNVAISCVEESTFIFIPQNNFT